MRDDLLWRVPFKIAGYVEIRARDGDAAWEKVHAEYKVQDLIDSAGLSVDFEVPECQE